MSKKKYKYVKLEVGSLAFEIAEEAVKNKKVVSKHLSERLESMEQKKIERLRFEFDVFLGMVETYSDSETRGKIDMFWPLFIRKFLNKESLGEGYISMLVEIVQEDPSSLPVE